MTVPGSTNPLLAYKSSAAAYTVSRSLRFNSADSPRLSRTPASSGNRKTWTWSAWVKRSKISDYQVPIAAGVVGSTPRTYLRFDNTDNIRLQNDSGFLYVTTAVYRDPGAWMHLVWAVDTTNATAADRVKLYVNGTQVTSFSTATTAALNEDTLFNSTSHTAYIGSENRSLYYLDGYLANVEFVDGQQVTPSSFAETNATTGQWVPRQFSGTYGTNGFKLTFSDNSNTTAATLGADTSGNGNNWTPSGFVVTAGAGNDSLRDTPTSSGTDTGVGGEVTGNYCTLNPLDQFGTNTLSNGNLDVTLGTDGPYNLVCGTIAIASGKWYWEVVAPTISGGTMIGISRSTVPASDRVYGNGNGRYYSQSGQKWSSATGQTYGASYAANDVIGVAFDMDAGTLTYYKNGVSQGTAFTGLTGSWFPTVNNLSSGLTQAYVVNFGQRAFSYPVSGFKALCDTNLTSPTITKSSTVMDTVLYTGTGASLTPTSSLGFSPDLVWIKSRSVSADHALYDTVRGATKDIASNLATAETTEAQGLTAFNSNGFTVGTLAKLNTNAATYAAWAWDCGSSDVSNTSGTITSTVRANASAGFSIVTYTGTGANATVGHSLNLAPQFMLVKNRGGATNWSIYHSAIGATKRLIFTSAAADLQPTIWNNTAPTSSVFSVGSSSGVNQSGLSHVAYCWTPVAGLSSFGSYVGNGLADGPFVFCNFRPRWILLKTHDNIASWGIYDTARNTFNAADKVLFANTTTGGNAYEAPTISLQLDILSNGFKLRDPDVSGYFNYSTWNYVYAAFAEFPFQYARAR